MASQKCGIRLYTLKGGEAFTSHVVSGYWPVPYSTFKYEKLFHGCLENICPVLKSFSYLELVKVWIGSDGLDGFA